MHYHLMIKYIQHLIKELCTQDPRTKDPRTKDQGPKDLRTQGPRTQRSSSVALTFYDRNATSVNVLSSNILLYHCGSQSPHCYTHNGALRTRLCYFTLAICLVSLFILHSANPRIVSFIACKTTSITSYLH